MNEKTINKETLDNQAKPLYEGKAKSLYATDNPDEVRVHFRDDMTAFDGEKRVTLSRKGLVNNYFNAFIMEHLEKAGIPTHFNRRLDDQHTLVKRLEMLPIECVVRNIATGSLCKRLGIEEGIDLSPAIFEFFLKNDELHDPMINTSHIETFQWATQAQLAEMKAYSFKVNDILKRLFLTGDMLLVDYKLEFGMYQGKTLILGDEFTPDGCRIWDVNTRQRMDKDCFRRGEGEDVIAVYEAVAQRLQIALP
jgi:phosphoribosylaminoimidazole-succinocarboxamide synthase